MTVLYCLEPDAPGAAWAPFAGAAPLHMLRGGAWRLYQRWEKALDATAKGAVAAHAAGAPMRGALPLVAPGSIVGPAWVVDITFAPKMPMRAVGNTKRLVHDRRPVAWRLDPGEVWAGGFSSGDGIVVDGKFLSGAYDLLSVLEQSLFADTLSGLEAGTTPVPTDVTVFGNPGAVAIKGAELEPGVILDVRKGAIILERGVQVRSGTRIEGPSWIHEGTLLLGGQMRHISVGPHCRLHGEVSTSVFMGYTNKSHDGFVGHSVIGEWVNLGAGTITSNLKNTYGPVNLDVNGVRVETARTNVGSLIGDHVKTAIGTLLPTGAVIGAGAQVFGAPRAPKYVAPFAWGDAGERCTEEAFITSAKRILPRRDVTVDASTEAALRALHHRMTGK